MRFGGKAGTILALTCFVAGCAPTPVNVSYWRTNNILQTRLDKKNYGAPRRNETCFSIVEFGEDGKPLIEQQEKNTLAALRSFRPKTVILFVHGWHNDASPANASHGKDLAELDGALERIHEAGGGRTMGIYIGWRGESWTGLKRWFTLDDRRRTARTIGNAAPFQGFLRQLAEECHDQKCNSIFIGHSLGGVMMEHAARKIICTTNREDQLPQLFLLLNSAELSDSTFAKGDIDAINRSALAKKGLSSTHLMSPKVISATSEGDSATKVLNPTNSLIHRHYGEKSIGWDPKTVTHKIVFRRYVDAPMNEKELFRRSLLPTLQPEFWAPTTNNTLQQYRVLPLGSRMQAPLFWNFRIPAAVVKDHNDIYNGKIIAVGASFLQMASTVKGDYPEDLDGLLIEIKSETKWAKDDKNSDSHASRRDELVTGAALRLPWNAKTVDRILRELDSTLKSQGRTDPHFASRYRQNLFSMLKFSYSAEGWTGVNKAHLAALLQKRVVCDALMAKNVRDTELGVGQKDRPFEEFLAFAKTLAPKPEWLIPVAS